jgi:hypothetical protein
MLVPRTGGTTICTASEKWRHGATPCQHWWTYQGGASSAKKTQKRWSAVEGTRTPGAGARSGGEEPRGRRLPTAMPEGGTMGRGGVELPAAAMSALELGEG